MNKYLTYFLLSSGISIGIYTFGYIKGKNNQEHKLLEANYKQLQSDYAKHARSEAETLSVVTNYNNELISKNTLIDNLKAQLENEKQYINSTNHITTDWLWYIQSATTFGVPIPSSTNRINASTTEVKADYVAGSIIDNFKICNANALRLEKLQTWLKAQESIYK